MVIEKLLRQETVQQIIGDTTRLAQPIHDLCYDARRAKENSVFFALQGRTLDGTKFISQAYENGSRIFVAQKEVTIPQDALLIVVDNSRRALSYASHIFFNKPSERLKVIGVTGTKGKTTTTTLLYKILSQSGVNAGVIGTNGAYFKERHIPTSNTTPESYEIHFILNEMCQSGVEVCFMEVSSQGLMMSRVEDVCFEIGVFTNMAHDHISDLEHPTFENYLHWKTHLFTLTKTALVNNDDFYVDAFTTQPQHHVYRYGIENHADFKAENVKTIFPGVVFTLNDEEVILNVPGKFNVYNALVVLGVCHILGGDMAMCRQLLATTAVSGRMETIENNKGILAILDYAHNGFALENVLTTLKAYDYNRLMLLFGSVGDRSQNRRQELAQVAAKYADVVMVTSDNPGFENPQAIIEEIVHEMANFKGVLYTQVDRQKAIEEMVSIACEKDIIVFAGKGHETYQLIKDVKVPFDERQIIWDALNKKS